MGDNEFDELYQSGDLIWVDPDGREWAPAHIHASLTEKVKRFMDWQDRTVDCLLNWLDGKDDIDFIVHADRLLRDLCNCENELPPCKICERLALLESE